MTERISLFVFSLDGMRLALPVEAVGLAFAACETAPLPGAPVSVVGAVNLHGEVIAILDLRPRLRLPARVLAATDYFVNVRVGGRTVALVASDIEGAVDVDANAIVPPPPHADSEMPIHGLVALADGLLLIEDPEAFLAPGEMQMLARSLDAASAS